MRPTLNILDDELVERIIEEARSILSEIGIEFLGENAGKLLEENGLKQNAGRYSIPSSLVDDTLAKAPESFTMYDRDGGQAAVLGGFDVNFVPGSSGLMYLDAGETMARKPTTADLARFTRLTDAMEHLYAASTAFVPADIPESISDAWRLYQVLLNTTKPVVTGAFSGEGLSFMARLLEAVRGGPEALADKPLAIFSCCPSSPLRFTEATSDNLIDCAMRGIPTELIGMPISGLVAPVTICGTLIQHTVENMSGLVLAQLASPGAPVLWGGSPSVFDIRNATTPLSAVESMMIAAGYVQIGKRLGVPTQCYMGLSDAKIMDIQVGLETAMGHMTAALARANSVSGAGMLELENCISPEKLVIDNEICGALKFMISGIHPCEDFPALDITRRILKEKNVIIDPHTMKHRPSQRQDPSTIICRADRKRWEKQGSTSISSRAAQRVEELLENHKPKQPSEDMAGRLHSLMKKRADELGMNEWPDENI